ncbi:MAG: phosphoglycerate dehydrogenase [Spirochaetaceae bacterium]|jgi:D-3-phosphoglycerate dehydrogenase|nr:phosphoglycerate dehydrogenase [Spirochaetaceae bacterium]
MFRIQTMNQISPQGLELFPRNRYEAAENPPNPDAILVRSADLRETPIPDSVQAIARAGAGYNNIPVSQCSERGIVVFNTPGGNANAVKELALAALLLASRNIAGGIAWTKTLGDTPGAVSDLVEKEKSRFEGPEIRGKILGVIGLGAIGVMVANDAVALGMEVMGYDPYISVDAAWNLSRAVRRADTLEELLAKADYLSLHLPLTDATEGVMNAEKFSIMKQGARIVNLARGGLAHEPDLIKALHTGRLSAYVTDFPSAELIACPTAICIPHLGASTPEAEDNCAVMAVRQLMDFLETGRITNSVNFPRCALDRRSPFRLLVANRNIPNMLGQITTILAEMNVNIISSINQSRDQYAYNIIDTEQEIPEPALRRITSVNGIVRVRAIASAG